MAKTELTVTMADGTEHRVVPTLEDTLKFETTLRKNKSWGSLQDSALKLLPFRAWSALSRTGVIDLTWEQFTTGDTAALDVSVVHDEEPDEDDELEVAGVGKATRTGAGHGSSSNSPSEPASPRASGSKSNPTT